MGAWFKRLWSDEAYFSALCRRLWPLLLRGGMAAVGVFGPELVNAGATGFWAGKVLTVLALVVPAGDVNDPLVKKLAQVTAQNVEKLANVADVTIASIKNGVK